MEITYQSSKQVVPNSTTWSQRAGQSRSIQESQQNWCATCIKKQQFLSPETVGKRPTMGRIQTTPRETSHLLCPTPNIHNDHTCQNLKPWQDSAGIRQMELHCRNGPNQYVLSGSNQEILSIRPVQTLLSVHSNRRRHLGICQATQRLTRRIWV